MNVPGHSFAALIGTRICHDLISPIGAIGNGLELLSLNGAKSGPEMELISQSLANAQARIRFYRIAFGMASRDQSVPNGEAATILRDVYGGGRINVRWTVEAAVPRPEAKLAFLLIQCLEAALPQGGDIEVARQGGAWVLSGRSERLRELGATWDLLAAPDAAADISPDAIQFALAALQAAELGRTVTMRRREREIALRA